MSKFNASIVTSSAEKLLWFNKMRTLIFKVLFLCACQVQANSPATDWRSQFNLAREYAARGENALAAEAYRQILKTYKDPFAANNLALLYKKGNGVPKNTRAAIQLLKLSVAYGSSKVFKFPGSPETTLGWLYLNGAEDLEPDPDEARKWTLEAARQGHPNAHSNLALMYVSGFGVPVDDVAAVAQLKLAIERYRDDFNWIIEGSEEDLWTQALRRAPPELVEARRLYWEAVRSGEKVAYLNKLTAIQTRLMSRNEKSQTTKEREPKRTDLKPNSAGTSFLISRDGLLVTNFHVISVCSSVYVETSRGQERVAILSKDPIQDIAFLKLKNYRADQHLHLSEDPPNLAQDVLVAGFPFGTSISSNLKLTKGIVSALVGPADNRAYIQIDAAVQPGNSGGPAVNSAGRVVGMITSKLDPLAASKNLGAFPENIAFGLKVGAIKAYAEELGYKQPTPSAEEKTRDQVAAALTASVFRVSCSVGQDIK